MGVPALGHEWKQQAKLTAKAGEETGAGEFGKSVAISEKGEYALIGGSGDNAGIGAAWVFPRNREHDLGPAGAKLTAKSGEETGDRRIRQERVDLRDRRIRADRRTRRQRRPRRGVRVLPRKRENDVDPARREAHREKRGRDRRRANSATACRSPATKGEYALIGAPGDKEDVGARVRVPAHRHDLGPAGREAGRAKAVKRPARARSARACRSPAKATTR